MVLATLNSVAATLVSAFEPASITVVANYHEASYICSNSTTTHLLYLTTSETLESGLAQLVALGVIARFAPPNLLHGLPAALVAGAALAHIPAKLLLLPTTTPATLAPSLAQSYHVEEHWFTEILPELVAVAQTLGWSWFSQQSAGGTLEHAFSWLQKLRREKRRQDAGAMYM